MVSDTRDEQKKGDVKKKFREQNIRTSPSRHGTNTTENFKSSAVGDSPVIRM